MITANTVLVLGAGANMPYGFPSGKELAYEIYRPSGIVPTPGLLHHPCSQIDPDYFSQHFQIPKDYLQYFKNALATSQLSVDAFLENRADEAMLRVGKLSIAAILLNCEKHDRLFIGKPPYHHFEDVRHSDRLARQDGHWYGLLWDRLCEPDNKNNPADLFDRIPESNLSIITFNYDRSLEYYLLTALQANTGRSLEDCKRQLSNIKIVHIYGSLGSLLDSGELAVPFGEDWFNNSHFLECAASGINLARRYAVDQDMPTIAEACSLLEKAHHIIFIGFGFDPVNLSRLGFTPGELVKYPARISATIQGISMKTKLDIKGIAGDNSLATYKISNRVFHDNNLFDSSAYDYIFNNDVLQ